MVLPGTVGNLHADPETLLATALGGGAVAGPRPTQAGPAVVVAAGRPAGPGAETPVHRHVTDLSVPTKRHELGSQKYCKHQTSH